MEKQSEMYVGYVMDGINITFHGLSLRVAMIIETQDSSI